jgi:hypothetical protein
MDVESTIKEKTRMLESMLKKRECAEITLRRYKKEFELRESQQEKMKNETFSMERYKAKQDLKFKQVLSSEIKLNPIDPLMPFRPFLIIIEVIVFLLLGMLLS